VSDLHGRTTPRRAEEAEMRKAVLVMTAVAMFLTLGPPAAADEIVCRGEIGRRTVDNVKVPQGASCTLRGTRVEGNVTINRNATLIAVNVRVDGNVQGENAKNVVLRAGSRVGGDVQVVQGKRARVLGSRVGGDILYDDQDGRVVVKRTTVGGNVQAFQNTGGVVIKNNVIDGNLQCKENQPRPTGGGNRVGGSKEDQCKRL
jgi:hypothetical protein